jgi:hypothetical protein
VLHRVPQDRVTAADAWETWGFTPEGGWRWGGPPTVALPGAFGELSLRRVPAPDGSVRWLLALFDAAAYRIDVLDLDSPLADLHTARRVTVLRGCDWATRTTPPGASRSSTAATSCPAAGSTTCTWWSASGTPPAAGPTGRCSSGWT